MGRERKGRKKGVRSRREDGSERGREEKRSGSPFIIVELFRRHSARRTVSMQERIS